MTKTWARGLCLMCALTWVACDSDTRTDGGVTDTDGGRIDSGLADSGITDPMDAGMEDSGTPMDATTPDTGLPDAGPPDSGVCEDTPCRLVSPQCGCAAGEGCTLNDSSERVCLPSGAGGEGGDCSVDACQAGFVCGEGPDFDVCLRFCEDDLDCVGGEGSRCLIDFGVARACTTACDPVANTGCPSGAGCTILETARGSGDYFTNCRPEGTAATGDVCGTEPDCVGGNSCPPSSGGGPRQCTAWCRSDGDCGDGETCAFGLTIGTTTYGRCM